MGVEVTKLCERREPQSESKYSLGLSSFVSLDHLQSANPAHSWPCSWPTRHLPVAKFTALLYRTFGMPAWGSGGGSIPHPGLK